MHLHWLRLGSSRQEPARFPDTGTGTGGTERRDLLLAAAIAAIAAALLLAQFLQLAGQARQFAKYPLAASRLVNGTLPAERSLDYSQAYLALHVLAVQSFRQPVTGLLAIHALLLASTAAVLYLLLRRFAGVALSLGGTAAFVLSRSVATYGYVFEPEPLLVFFLVVFLFFAPRSGLPSSGAASLSLACCLLVRPVFLPLAFLTPLLLWLRPGARGRRALSVALFLLPLAAAGLLLVGRSRQAHGPTLAPFMNPGTVFFDGNNPLSDGVAAAFPPLVYEVAAGVSDDSDAQHVAYRLLARRVAGRDLTPAEVNRFWLTKAWNFLGDHPAHFARRVARRALYLFHEHRWHDLGTATEADEFLARSRWPSVPFALISSLACIGLVAGLRRWRELLLVYAAFISQAAVMTATYVTDRQRFALLPCFVLFAVLALGRLGRRPQSMLAILVVAALLFPLLRREDDLMRDSRHVWSRLPRMQEARAASLRLRDAGDRRGSLELAATALSFSPWMAEWIRPAATAASRSLIAAAALERTPVPAQSDFPARLDRAVLLLETGLAAEAAAAFAALEKEGHTYATFPDRVGDPAYYRGRIAAAQGRREEAVRHLERAARRVPGDPAVLAHLAALTGDERHVRALYRYFDDLDAGYFLGRSYLENGAARRAVPLLADLASRLPEYCMGIVYLGASLADEGRSEEAAAAFLQGLERCPDPALYPERTLAVFRTEADRHPGDQRRRFESALALKYVGRTAEARALLADVVAMAPDQRYVAELRKTEEEIERLRSAGGEGEAPGVPQPPASRGASGE